MRLLTLLLLFTFISCNSATKQETKPMAATKASEVKGEKVKIVTNMGEMTLLLNREKAPLTVANFMKYVENKKYDGTIFHRVIKNFMIQGGGFDPNMKQKETYAPIKNEAFNGLKNDYGTIAMARTGDPHSATGQFFINSKNNDFLNHTNKTQNGWGYTVFGKLIDGYPTLKKIGSSSTHSVGYFRDVPVNKVIIKSIRKL